MTALTLEADLGRVFINRPTDVRFQANRTLSRHRRMTKSDPKQA
jgi:hypothetical protein